jgi:diadenosine tetraphosphate (Ap4A) HIT family hydrolase
MESVFLTIPENSILYRNEAFFIIKDRYPVSKGHLLIISNRVHRDIFMLDKEEFLWLHDAISVAKQLIDKEYKPDGYNIGMNCGESAGQTIFHFHCHIIPRYQGDMDDPRGGVRHVIVGEGYY